VGVSVLFWQLANEIIKVDEAKVGLNIRIYSKIRADVEMH
jgi:ATP/ADP translocase